MPRERPPVADDEIGIRAHLTSRDRAVERATQLLRHALADEWAASTDDEVECLEWALGEVWASSSRDEWETLRFGHVPPEDFARALALSKRLRKEYSLRLIREIETLFSRERP